MDTFSRKIVGWSIDSAQASNLVVNALDMAIKNRQPAAGGIVHADRGAQFTSWAFTNKIRASGLMPSFGTVGDCYDNSIDKSPSGRACRSSCSTGRNGAPGSTPPTRCSSASRSSYNRQRRHSKLGYVSPIEHEPRFNQTSIPA
jgi:putative transposase